MIKVTLLGTSGSTPTKSRGMPSVALTYNGRVYLFDCGEGTQMRMLEYGVNISKVETVFLSHIHGDHVIGIAGLIRTLALNNRQKPLVIHVPKGQESGIKSLIVFDKAIIKYQIIVKGIGGGTVYKGDGFEVDAFRLNHQITTLGYVFNESDKLRFIKDKCKALGIKGEMFAQLGKKGKIKIGKRTIRIKDVTTLQKGKKVLYVTDTRPMTGTVRAARNAEILIHEAAYTEKEKNLAKERKHSTAYEAAHIAKLAKAKLLIITHLSARHRNPDALYQEARKVFKNTVIGNDGYTTEI
ncbi:MAG: ribonuclease Z [Candidatus Micrarchaeota archaeon]|nr:ribonuclease Z [Candidatus Micrarchaeota archaeon]